MCNKYVFRSERLGFRNWVEEDRVSMHEISSDPVVMEHFPTTATFQQTSNFISRMQEMFRERGYCYFAVDRLVDGAFIGFIGLCYQDYEASFTPCTDIGWRLGAKYWGKGYATEGAARCLGYAFGELGLVNIKAIATKVNIKSFNVMKKVGMVKELEFEHPSLIGHDRIKDCFLYEISAHV